MRGSKEAEWLPWLFNTLSPRQNGRHFPDNTFKCIFLNENVRISITISLKFVRKGPINNIPALVQIMAWRRPGDKPLSEPMLVSLPTYICVTRPQRIKGGKQDIHTGLPCSKHLHKGHGGGWLLKGLSNKAGVRQMYCCGCKMEAQWLANYHHVINGTCCKPNYSLWAMVLPPFRCLFLSVPSLGDQSGTLNNDWATLEPSNWLVLRSFCLPHLTCCDDPILYITKWFVCTHI